MGVIPRAVFDMFQYMSTATEYSFNVSVSYMELYQENLYDLLSHRPREQCIVDIREDSKGIKIPGLVEHPVTTAEDTIKCLIDGSAGRATGATAMNAQSSRSHAIFTVTVFMEKKNDTNSATTSKFHLVDLAGSERSKKTKATGERFREGVNINRGLLALGNVISALGDDAQKGYISYRDSKLTRLLQDSLGGNSMTLMIACVSPADYNLDETISTLRYADRARKIKNKPIINQDPQAAEIARLHQIIQQLRVDRIGACGGGGDSGNGDAGTLSKMKDDMLKLQNKNRDLNNALSAALTENTAMFERALLTQTANERLQKKLLELKETYNVTLSNLNITIEQTADCPSNIKEHMDKLNSMKNMITDLQSEQKKNEEEIQRHEYQCQTNAPAVDHDLHNCQPDLDERQESHTKEQLNLNMELQELNRVLALKEQLASQIMTNANHMVDYAAIAENETKITALEKEKEELVQQLRNVKSNAASSKIAEQRRKRVKELETHISELNKKVIEQARMIKLKEKDESKMKQLANEIQAMKSNKVKLIKTMRAEEQKFRTWKLQREKDLMRLKDQDRKRQNQIVRMEHMHSKQQTVLKRKVEEAVAINKRLKDALALQKQAQDRRGQHYGKTERIEQWVAQELEVMVSTIDAERTLDQLLEDRALLTKQLSNLRNNADIADTAEGAENIRQLTEDIELRSAQIADLQQKIIDSDQENKVKTRWETVQSMVEAKCALKKLFDLAADIRRKSANNEYKLEELHAAHEEAMNRLSCSENLLKELSNRHTHMLSEIEHEYEEKITVLLKQLRGITTMTEDEHLKERLQIQEEALEKMDELRKELDGYKEEVELLREKLLKVNKCETKPEKKKPMKIIDTTFVKDREEEISSSAEDEDVQDDDDNDPDWKKTPLYRRIAALRSRQTAVEHKERSSMKRSSDGSIKCSCKGNCSSKICGCRKMSTLCSDTCKCAGENCQNRDTTQLQAIAKKLFDDDDGEDSFKKPTALSERNDETYLKRRKVKKSYFN
ncbi:Kinesin-like protein at 3A [Carabus blaptoides fortunei]